MYSGLTRDRSRCETLETCREVVLSRSVHQETCFQVKVMAAAAQFFQEAFSVCPDGILPDVNFRMALKVVHTNERIFFSNENLETWAEETSGTIRQVARYFRMVNESENEKKATWKKALGMHILQKNGHSDLEGVCGRGGGGRVALNVFRVVLMLEMQIMCVVFRAA